MGSIPSIPTHFKKDKKVYTLNLDGYLTKGNLTTFATWIGILLYPILIKYGIEIDQVVLTTLIYTTIVIIIAIISSANPNTLNILGNGPVVDENVNEEDEIAGDGDDS